MNKEDNTSMVEAGKLGGAKAASGDGNGRKPAYLRIADLLRNEVTSNGLSADTRLGSQREFVERFDVSSITVEAALRELQDQGLVYRVRGKGTFVAAPQAPTSAPVDTARIGVVGHVHTNWDTNVYARDVFQAVESYARRTDCYVRFIEQESDYVRLVEDAEVDGLVIITPSEQALDASGLVPGRHPYVVIGEDHGDHPCVTVDNEEMMRTALTHLKELGHHDIALITDPLSAWDTRRRWDAFLRFYAENGWVVRPEWIFHSESWMIQGEEAEESVFQQMFGKRHPTAVLAMGSFFAADVIRILESRGISVPGDISVMGLDLPPVGTPCRETLTTILQPVLDIGHQAMQNVWEQITHGPSARKIVLPCTLRAGATTAPPREIDRE